jgi:hypothetical protein
VRDRSSRAYPFKKMRPLLHKAGMLGIVMMMVMMVAYNYHHLRLRRDRCREAEGKHKPKH